MAVIAVITLLLNFLQVLFAFDEAAKGLAGGTISRRRALKMTGAALLGAALVPFSSAPSEAAGECSNRPAINNRRCTDEAICRSTETQACICARTVSGNKRCVNGDPTAGKFIGDARFTVNNVVAEDGNVIVRVTINWE